MARFELELFASGDGWQDISFPLKTAITTVPDVLCHSLVAGVDFDILQHYDQGKPGYRQWASFMPPSMNDLDDLSFKDGFHIHVLRDCTLVIEGELCEVTDVVPLVAGFTHAGFPSPSKPGYTVAQAKDDTGASAMMGCAPHPCNDTDPLGDEFVLYTGGAFWFQLASPHDWIGWFKPTHISPEDLATLNGYVATAEALPWEKVGDSPVGDRMAPLSSDWDVVKNYIATLGVTYYFDPLLYEIDLATGEIISIR